MNHMVYMICSPRTNGIHKNDSHFCPNCNVCVIHCNEIPTEIEFLKYYSITLIICGPIKDCSRSLSGFQR